MNLQVPNPFPPEDLDWLAFCYVNDELSEADQQAFETRLMEDQLAREAVEKAVERQTRLATVLRLDSAELKPEPRRWGASQPDPSYLSRPYPVTGRRFRFTQWVAAAAALVLLGLGLFWQLSPSSTQPGANLAGLAPTETEELPSEEWISDEDYADQLADALAAADQDLDQGLPHETVGEYTPVTLQNDWMLDVFSELGDEWEDPSGDDLDDSTSLRSDLRGNWG